MLKEKNALLIQELNKLVKKYGNNTKIRDIIKREFEQRNKLSSFAIRILTEKLPLETLDIENQEDLFLLFIFTKALQQALSKKDEILNDTIGMFEEYTKIDVNNYFTELEIETFNDLKLEKKEISKYPYVFDYMLKFGEGHYSGLITDKQLAEIDAANDIIYNFNIQRDPIIDVFGNKKINMEKNKIEKIDKLLENKDYFPDEIKINILKDGEDKIEFISKDGIFGKVIVHSGIMTIFDGYHRKTANSIAVSNKPDLGNVWKFAITNFAEFKAKKFMKQVNEQKPMKYEHTQNIDVTINQNLVVDEIKNNALSELAGQIKDYKEELKYGGLTTKLILSNAINEQYGDLLESKVYIKTIADWIVEVSNYMIGWWYENDIIFTNLDLKKNSYITHKNMFAGYVALTKYLYQKSDWKEKLKEVFNSIDFSVNNEIWKEIDLTNDNFTKTTRNQLYKLFKKGDV